MDVDVELERECDAEEMFQLQEEIARETGLGNEGKHLFSSPRPSKRNVWECSSLPPTSPMIRKDAAVLSESSPQVLRTLVPLISSPTKLSDGLDDDYSAVAADGVSSVGGNFQLHDTSHENMLNCFDVASDHDRFFSASNKRSIDSTMDDADPFDADKENPFSKLKKRAVRGQVRAFTMPKVLDRVDTQPMGLPVQPGAVDNVHETQRETSSHVPYEPGLLPVRKREARCKYLDLPVSGGFKKATSFNGTRLYFGYDSIKRIEESLGVSKKVRLEHSLLERSAFRLMEDIQAENTSNSVNKRREAVAMTIIENTPLDTDEEIVRPAMWVDKYRPSSYVDLMSDEWLNQEVMLWVKQWDPCVFPKDPKKSKPSESLMKRFRHKSDSMGRPEKKLLLLAGPPGYGKTTLAHVIAKQCGYRVFEVNASDERTSDVVSRQIKDAVESKSVFGDKKPNLIVIDEIDGATGGSNERSFIKSLIDLVTPKPQTPAQIKRSKAKGKGHKPFQLVRPIICICNDAYVPALRPLRMIAHIYHFRPPTVSILAKRLKMICTREDLKIESRALSTLVEKSDGDMRSCLNTLQMLATKLKQQDMIANALKDAPKQSKRQGVTLAMIEKASVGLKDLQKSVFPVWESIFYKEKQPATFAEQSSLVEANGDYDLIMAGCFESYLLMDFQEQSGSGSNILNVLDQVAFFDVMRQKSFEGYPQALNYLPYPIKAFQVYTAHRGPRGSRSIQFPKESFSVRQQQKIMQMLASDFLVHLDGRTRIWMSNESKVCSDFISLILRIISPPIRPVNPHLIKGHELKVLNRLVRLMTTLKLTFRSEKGPTGTAFYALEP
eukprot:Partr_v1_DN27526_c0_g1_i1_m30670 putative chromosome transmission fidelity